ncbi:sigma-54-dependent transcriptional regulator [Shewanella gelidii]|uniref:Sigma-54-dependent Fis family transcriptional regulator n=1 Tax=Shewanella gelidii TaxID=1642821 RepID=A0A917N602_9GAMM|nr:sigma-54 dependent transcriptional regulator [Shewanella gelidii]MCL1096391.1 sigma-54 dependent transcriptional regulator [Shewanella gelidii]GGI67137.1 sigma-54-dependent Fis family transcriptional regulator [Shewanella gelidii]
MDKQIEFTALLVEDSMSLGALYTEYLRAEGAKVTLVHYGQDALSELAKWQPELLILDIKLPDISGMEVLETVQKKYPDISVIMITAHGTIDIAVDAMRAGAFDFLVKPFDAKRLSITLRNALKQKELFNLVAKYENSLPKANFQGFIGNSLAMQAVYKTIDSVANSKASVFVVGESGTGKEVCAHAIHNAGSRRDKPFVALNCASIPKDLIESEIFGHTKGAFTGAHANRDGAATRAHGGTLFLDEICEMDLELQSKLLRFIQTGVFQRVGGSREEKVDVRFISATNRAPWDEVKAGRFREDLFYRLHVIPIELPPLRMRGKDILLLAKRLLKEYNREEGKSFARYSEEAIQSLLRYNWPGNVRQLQNVVRQAVVLGSGQQIELSMLPQLIDSNHQPSGSRVANEPSCDKQPLPQIEAVVAATDATNKSLIGDELSFSETALAPDGHIQPLWLSEKQTIEAAIAQCDGNVPKAAALLDISASTIYRKRQSWEEKQEADA